MNERSDEGLPRWRGKTALVTGASSGIGRATATALADAGLRVVLCARRAAELDRAAAEITASGGEALPVPTDLRDESSILAAFDAARRHFGGVDVLINAAGLGYATPLTDGDTAMWREMLEVNVLALCICTREAISDMRRRAVDGHIVHVSSMSGHRVPSASGVYSATKFAVRSLTEGLRKELREAGSGIRVTSVSPGFVETGFAAHYNHGDEDAAQRIYGRYKVLQSEDVAAAIVYVLGAPPHVQVHDLLMRPTRQES